MAAQREPAWTTHEKNALLAEIIKVNAPNPQVLLNVINSLNMSPRLEEVPLPQGRSFTSCRNAFEALRREPPIAMTPGPMGVRTSSPMSAPLMTHGKRPFPFEGGPQQPGRQLAPKPMTGGPYGQSPSQIEQPPKKKRGRPTKAEAQAKAEAQSVAGESSSTMRLPLTMAPMATPVMAQPPELPPPVQTPVERRESQPAVSRMNINSMLAATPTGPGPGSASHSGSSSGRSRRRRSTRSEPEGVPSAGTAGAGEPFPEYESPYARIGGEGLESPARAAMTRRREGPHVEEQQRPGGQQPPMGYAPQSQQQPGQGQGQQ